MYGMGVSALKVNLGTDRKEAQKFYDDYFAKFSGLAKYLENVKVETARTGFTDTVFGRRRYCEGIRSKLPFIKAMNERMAINAPIQGTGADITKLAMIKVEEYLTTNTLSTVHLLLQVHDELVYEMPAAVVEQLAPQIKNIMENVVDLEKTKNVVLKVDYKVGDNWGEMQTHN
jgi:DNA polymerase-1